MGPAQVESVQGNKYFVSFIDVFSCFSGVYFMKSTTEVLGHYKTFVALLENQTGWTVKALCMDGGKEYNNDKFLSFIQEKGILHKTTALHSSAQNGIAERMM